jgi:hypothetical protein
LVETIYNKVFLAQGSNKEKLTHYLRHVIACHIFNIYELYGLRVPIPEIIGERHEAFVKLLNEGFLTFGFLKKELIKGGHTSTNVPVILTIIAMMIQKGDVTITSRSQAEKNKGNLEKVFDARIGKVKSIESLIPQTLHDKSAKKQDEFWYIKHVKIGFKWKEGLARKDDPAMDLEELFESLVFGLNPFVETITVQKQKEINEKEDLEENLEEEEMDDFGPELKPYRDHFNRLEQIMSWLTKEDILNTLKIQDKETSKKTATSHKDEFNGWMSASEMKELRKIMIDNNLEDTAKRSAIQRELTRMKETYLAKAVNIGMHIALWTPPKAKGKTRHAVIPLGHMDEIDESVFANMKQPGKQKKNQPPIIFPKALDTIRKETSKIQERIIKYCVDTNCDSPDFAKSYDQLRAPKRTPTFSNYQLGSKASREYEAGIKTYDPFADMIPMGNVGAIAVTKRVPRKRKGFDISQDDDKSENDEDISKDEHLSSDSDDNIPLSKLQNKGKKKAKKKGRKKPEQIPSPLRDGDQELQYTSEENNLSIMSSVEGNMGNKQSEHDTSENDDDLSTITVEGKRKNKRRKHSRQDDKGNRFSPLTDLPEETKEPGDVSTSINQAAPEDDGDDQAKEKDSRQDDKGNRFSPLTDLPEETKEPGDVSTPINQAAPEDDGDDQAKEKERKKLAKATTEEETGKAREINQSVENSTPEKGEGCRAKKKPPGDDDESSLPDAKPAANEDPDYTTPKKPRNKEVILTPSERKENNARKNKLAKEAIAASSSTKGTQKNSKKANKKLVESPLTMSLRNQKKNKKSGNEMLELGGNLADSDNEN